MVLQNWCAAGEPNMIRLSPQQFKPRNPELGADGKTMFAICHYCEQRTIVKQAEPRKGFFIRHNESQKGYRSASDTRSGEPARERNRK